MAVDKERSLRSLTEEIAAAMKPLTDEGLDSSLAAQVAMSMWLYKEKGFPITPEGREEQNDGECNCAGCQARRAMGNSVGQIPSMDGMPPHIKSMMEGIRNRLQGGGTPPNMMMIEVPENMIDEKGAERFCDAFIPKFTPEALALTAKRFKKACK
jgi:hypothetical protein